MKKVVLVLSAAAAAAAVAKEVVPRPEPVFVPRIVHTNEQPVAVACASEAEASNGLYRLVKTTVTFTNPNSRVFEGELEFPVPEGATVCGYELEVNGDMIPGVVVGKEEARTAFENEKRKGIDPGIVEHVKGNVWRTRIYPLNPNQPRRASVTVIEPLPGGELTRNVVLFAVLIYELVGPSLTKRSLIKVGEIRPEGRTSSRTLNQN